MPYLKIQSNQPVKSANASNLIVQASKIVAQQPGKPENYAMAALEPPIPMVFAGDDTRTVFMELKSIGLSESQTSKLSVALCELINTELDVSTDVFTLSLSMLRARCGAGTGPRSNRQ